MDPYNLQARLPNAHIEISVSFPFLPPLSTGDCLSPAGQELIVSATAMMNTHDLQLLQPPPLQHEPMREILCEIPLRHKMCKCVRINCASSALRAAYRRAERLSGAPVRSVPKRFLARLARSQASSAFWPLWKPMAASKSFLASTELRIQTDTDRGDSDINTNGDHNGITNASASNATQPSLFHKIKNQKSILAIAVSDSRIYAGTQGGDLLVRQ